jgi:multidrug efflux pump subunit AcrA (membrane-fusion protein)
MKMEHPVLAPAAGTVSAVHVRAGDAVDAGTVLLEFDPDPATDEPPLATGAGVGGP